MINAEEARRLSAEAVRTDAGKLGGLVAYVCQQIDAAARDGRREVVDPLKGIRTPTTAGERELVYDELRRQGYEVRYGGQLDEYGVSVTW